MSYALLDSGEKKKLERFGPYTLIRPAQQALWPKKFPSSWLKTCGTFTRQETNQWQGRALPASWTIRFRSLQLQLSLTEFGHLGFFPEHAMHWQWMGSRLRVPSSVLHLFAYSGATTLALTQLGHRVCHLDASEKMVAWARENARLNGLEKAPIRWIVDDVFRFLRREVKRGSSYDALLLDPPSFGRGNRGQVFKIEQDLYPLLQLCSQLLSPQGSFVLLTAHTPGLTPLLLKELLLRSMPQRGAVDCGEMVLKASQGGVLPSGAFARWEAHG